MTIADGFGIALVVVIVAVVVAVLAIVGVKLVRARTSRRRESAIEDGRRAVLLAFDDPRALDGLDPEIVEAIAVRMLSQLRGSDRDELASRLDEAGVVAAARDRLRDRRPGRRIQAADLLGLCADDELADDLIDELSERLDDRDLDVRQSAARALGRIGDGRAVPALVQALTTRQISVNTAGVALLRLGAEDPGPLPMHLRAPHPRVRATVAEVLGELGEVHVRHEIADLLHDDPVVWRSAVRALGQLQVNDVVPRLVLELEILLGVDEGDGEVAGEGRSSAGRSRVELDSDTILVIEALRSIGDPSAIPTLESCRDRSSRVAAAADRAIRVLDRRGPDRPFTGDPQTTATVEGASGADVVPIGAAKGAA
ncbi:MAG: HEAT repeat domain-containing protein [Actinomycetota bacterium]